MIFATLHSSFQFLRNFLPVCQIHRLSDQVVWWQKLDLIRQTMAELLVINNRSAVFHIVTDFTCCCLIHHCHSGDKQDFVIQCASADFNDPGIHVSVIEQIETGLQLIVVLFWKIAACYLAGERECQTNFSLKLTRKEFFNLFKFRSYLLVFIVFSIWNTVPIKQTFRYCSSPECMLCQVQPQTIWFP